MSEDRWEKNALLARRQLVSKIVTNTKAMLDDPSIHKNIEAMINDLNKQIDKYTSELEELDLRLRKFDE